tara:strand:+ start:691 stop:960 length:270 start_codon:yes stop_codon:yes gene_type:complete
MLFKFSTEQIENYKRVYVDAYGCLMSIVDLAYHEKLEEIRYPNIKYANSVEEGWQEFTLCFHKDREKVYQDMLRPKYKDGNKTYRIMGN